MIGRSPTCLLLWIGGAAAGDDPRAPRKPAAGATVKETA